MVTATYLILSNSNLTFWKDQYCDAINGTGTVKPTPNLNPNPDPNPDPLTP